MSAEHRMENDKICLDLWRREGGRQVLDKLIREYEAKVFSVILYLSGCDWNTAYEITADCLAETLAELKSSPQETLSVRLFDRVVQKCRTAKAVLFFDPLKFINAAEGKKNVLRTANRALHALPFDERVMLLLRDQANLSYVETAAVMRVPLHDIKTMTWQARNHFREKVEDLMDKGACS